MMQRLHTLWQFSRPHTIIGSVVSITVLYILACAGQDVSRYLHLLWPTLISALGCNVFITGLNQLTDVEMDKINKPWLPLAAGTLGVRQARRIIFAALAVCLLAAAWLSWYLLAVMAVILLLGIAYSVPPIRLKRHHLPAALAITLVRGLIVNIGIYLHYHYEIYGSWQVPGLVWQLTVFIMAFSIAIAWFKDLPDTAGDAEYRIKTLALLYSRQTALRGGAALVLAAYARVLWWAWQIPAGQGRPLFWAHAVLLLLFLLNLATVNLERPLSVKRFYLRFWVFFFAEYAMFAWWVIR